MGLSAGRGKNQNYLTFAMRSTLYATCTIFVLSYAPPLPTAGRRSSLRFDSGVRGGRGKKKVWPSK